MKNSDLRSRLSSGCEGLDEVLKGGLFSAQTYLLVGSPGTGKTVLSMQFLREGLRCGERALYVTLTEPAPQLQRNVDGFGWSLEGVDVQDLSPDAGIDRAAGEEYRMFAPDEVERVNAWKRIYEVVEQTRPQRVVLDSATQLRYLSTDEYQFRKHVLSLIAYLNDRGCTTLMLFEPSVLESERSLELAVDGVVHLRFRVSAALSMGLRSVEVTKLRGSDFLSGYHPMRITDAGVKVYAHRVESPDGSTAMRTRMSSGNASLDELLGGGIETGTTTILSGPAGVGKSTLGVQFLMRAEAPARAAMLTFEESRDSVLDRCRGIGLGVDAAVASGALQIHRINPLELYPDQLLEIVRDLVERQNVRLVMIDSLRGYQLAMEEFGKPLAQIHNLLSYLSRLSVTTILVSEAEHITSESLSATDMGVSHLADNIVLMRYAEYAGQIIKIIGCLKKRLGGFQPELRELRITSQGIEVSKKLEGLRGILTGVPTLQQAGA